MRQIGYLSFVVVLLYGLTLFAVSCDNDEILLFLPQWKK